jgi:AraC-like DNA-binding protein
MEELLSSVALHRQRGADATPYGGSHTYTVVIPVHGALETMHRGRTVDADRDRAAVFQPDDDVGLRCGDDCTVHAVSVDTGALEDVLEQLLGHAVRRPIDMAASLDLRSPAGRAWTRLVRHLVAPAVLLHPVLERPAQEAVLARLLLAVDHPYREELDAPVHSWAPHPVGRMVDAVEAAPERPFTNAELADEVGLSGRTLQECCQRHLDLSPAEQLRTVRMVRAHQELAHAAGEADVDEVGWHWGFADPGRFVTDYSVRYGVSPWQTQRGPAYA